jgi:methyl-accepting chemotaxis protein
MSTEQQTKIVESSSKGKNPVKGEAQAKLSAIDGQFATIEFELDGIIRTANANFLTAMGYELDEVVGKHHHIFCRDEYTRSSSYQSFWERLARGEAFSDCFERVKKSGESIWIQAAYMPLKGSNGSLQGVLKIAQDVTQQILKERNVSARMTALNKSQAVIEFLPDGTIVEANQNFLSTVGYAVYEIEGQHHRMFCDPELVKSPDYANFWRSLAAGDYKTGEFLRFKKDGSPLWLQASYNPIFNQAGDVYRVVKFAADITEQKLKTADYEGQLEAISQSQAVIEFDMQGNIQNANENFLTTMGYDLAEVQGKHHSMFVDPEYRRSAEYEEFWDSLRQGKFQTAEYLRYGKDGREVWIQATYSPILNPQGQLFKVVKYATDITAQKTERERLTQELSTTAEGLSAAATQLQQVGQQMVLGAVETSKQANAASRGAEQVNRNVQSTAAATEEMSASITEISQNASEAARESSRAVQVAKETNLVIQHLGTSSLEIGNVVKVISSIAEQTNLLALNATIEAARAGEAGKGFAVVANEVKELAKETSTATEDISKKIEAIQKDSQGAVDAIASISSLIERLNDISGNIAGAVEEQTATTSEMARSINEAASSSQSITHSIGDVAKRAETTSEGAGQNMTSAKQLSTYAATLSTLVEDLRTS